jgi:hypothetical protein
MFRVLREREQFAMDGAAAQFPRQLSRQTSLVHRLELQHVLDGHDGKLAYTLE